MYKGLAVRAEDHLKRLREKKQRKGRAREWNERLRDAFICSSRIQMCAKKRQSSEGRIISSVIPTPSSEVSLSRMPITRKPQGCWPLRPDLLVEYVYQTCEHL